MKPKTAKKRFWEMTDKERAAEVKEFDHELPALRYKRLPKAERERFERARRAGGSRVRSIHSFNLDSELVDEAAAYARSMKLSVNDLVELGLRKMIRTKR